MSTTYTGQTFTGTPKPAGADNNAHGVDADANIYDNCQFLANGASEALKCSKKWRVYIIGGVSHGGVEDCHDYVRGGDLFVVKHRFVRHGARQDVTIKGSFKDAVFAECPGLTLIEAGNYTKYDAKLLLPSGKVLKALPWRCVRPPVRGGFVSVAPDQPKVVVRLFHSEPWAGDVINKPLVPWMPLHRLLVSVYFWARATFFKEVQPMPEEEFQLTAREI